MKNDIISKLTELFWKENLSEPETLYILVQIRKLAELSKREDLYEKYSTLFFYCDWAVHAKLDRQSAKKALEQLAANWHSEENLKFIGFITFRDELRSFLKDFQLPTHTVSNQDYWFEMRKNLIQILVDIPLETKEGPIIKFTLQNEWLDSDYAIGYEATFQNGEKERWNIRLADFGEKRRKILHEEHAAFLQKFANKIKFRREIADRKANAHPRASPHF